MPKHILKEKRKKSLLINFNSFEIFQLANFSILLSVFYLDLLTNRYYVAVKTFVCYTQLKSYDEARENAHSLLTIVKT